MTTFHAPRNNSASTVASTRAPGGPTIAVASGTPFGSTFPLLVAALRGPRTAETVLCILEVTGRTGNTLAISGAVEGTTDVTISPPDRLEVRPTALALTEVHDAIHAAESSIATLQAGVAAAALDSSAVHRTGNETVAGTKTFTSTIVASISGNAATATNGVVTTGSYADPAWVTSLAKSKVGLGSVDNTSDAAKPVSAATQAALDAKADDSAAVHRTGAETVAGVKTFSSTIVASISGNAGTATNGVVTTGSYADPSWIASLAKSKVGLGSVDNTSDAAKPISTATQTALDAKAALSHTHTASQVSDFAEAVDDRVATLLVEGSGVTLTYDDAANTLTIAASGGGGGGTPGGSPGQVQVNVAGAFGGYSGFTHDGTNLTVTGPGATNGIIVDGSTNPAYQLRNAGATKYYLGLVTSNNSWLIGTVTNDIVHRTEGGSIHFSVDSGASTSMTLDTTTKALCVGTSSPDGLAKMALNGTSAYSFSFMNSGTLKTRHAQAFGTGQWAPGTVAGDHVLSCQNYFVTVDGGTSSAFAIKPGGVGVNAPAPAAHLDVRSVATGRDILRAQNATGQTGDAFAHYADDGTTKLAWVAADGKYRGDGSALAGQHRPSTFGAYGTIATGASKAVKFALEAQAAYWLHATCDSGSFTALIEISTDDKATWSTFEAVTVTSGGTVSRSSSGAIAAGAYLRPNYTSATACDTPTVTLHARTT